MPKTSCKVVPVIKIAHIYWWRHDNGKQSASAREDWCDISCDIPYCDWHYNDVILSLFFRHGVIFVAGVNKKVIVTDDSENAKLKIQKKQAALWKKYTTLFSQGKIGFFDGWIVGKKSSQTILTQRGAQISIPVNTSFYEVGVSKLQTAINYILNYIKHF